jgi:hypothetical protein
MDWMNRGSRPNQPMNQNVGHPPAHHEAGHSRKTQSQKLLKVSFVTLLFSGTVLLVALLLYTAFGTRSHNEGRYVDTSKFQAIFLNGGQVYFGHIKTVSSKYLRVDNIYYLRVNQQVQPNGQPTQNSTPELVKLGCELHRPQDEMVINREQIIFWENLKDDASDATVPGAIKKYLASHPNGEQTCQTAPAADTSNTNTKKP